MEIQELIAKAWKRFDPPPDLKVSTWANRFRRLSAESSAEPGEFDMNRTPFMREIVDSYCEPEVETTAVKKSAQVAYSENLNNIFGYIVHIVPGPIGMLQPTLEMAESYSKDRISTAIRDTPVLRSRIDDRSKTSGNTILHKVFPGGLFQIMGSNSAPSLASRPLRDLLGDEPDRWPASAGKEGDPWGLLSARQLTFFNRKSFIGGTPTVKGASRIDKMFDRGDRRKYHVPCPRCGDHITLDREHFDTEPTSPTYAQYRCQACDGWIQEHERFDMIRDEVAGGTAHWIATAPNDGRFRSYFIWAAYSPFIGWRAMFDRYNEALGDPEEEQVVHNTLFGESYEFSLVDLDYDALFRSREDYDGQRLPMDVIAITAGVDTQDDRFEVEIVAWGPGEESWSLEYFTVDGDPEEKKTRDALDAHLGDAVFIREDGREMTISAAFVDAGGHRTDAVYKFTRGKAFRHIYASKGSSIAGQPIFARFSPLKKERIKQAIVGTDTAKEVIYSRLAKGSEARGRCHFPLSYDLQYFKGLVSEEKKIKWTKGGPVVRYEKKKPKKGERSARNEPLDCRVYALAALRSLPMALRKIRRAERVVAPAPAPLEEVEEAPVPEPIEEPEESPPPAPAPPQKRKQHPRRPGRGGGWSVR